MLRTRLFPAAIIAIALHVAGCSENNPLGSGTTEYDTITVSFQDGVDPGPLYFETRDAILKNGTTTGMRNANFGAVPLDTLGYAPIAATYYERRMIVRADFTYISSCSQVLDGSLSISIEKGGPDSLFLDASEVTLPAGFTQSWPEGSGGAGSGVSWATIDGQVSWTNPGGDYLSPPIAEAAVGDDSVIVFDLPPAVLHAWILEPTLNHGIIIGVRGAPEENYRLVHLRETSAAKRPRFTIRYLRRKGGG
jgi:hypothetical protein